MSAGYAIFNINVTNPENYKHYIEQVSSVAKKFGAEYIVRGGENQVIEGTWQHPRTVVMRFPSYEKALEWYNSDTYKPLKELRQKGSEGNIIIIKGI